MLSQLGEAYGSSDFSKFLLDLLTDCAARLGFKWVSILGVSRKLMLQESSENSLKIAISAHILHFALYPVLYTQLNYLFNLRS